jgi:hypothetical protein
MLVRITETGATESLSIIDPRSGCDWVIDYIGNAGAFEDGQFRRSKVDDEMECDQDTFDWWQNQIERQQAADYRIHALCDEHGSERVYAALHDAYSGEFESEPDEAMAALDAEFGEAAE